VAEPGRGRALTPLRALLATAAAALAALTGGRWLVAPAIELYALRNSQGRPPG
jgi:hypothetical protein